MLEMSRQTNTGLILGGLVVIGLLLFPIVIPLPSLAADDEALVGQTNDQVLMAEAKKQTDGHPQKECKKG